MLLDQFLGKAVDKAGHGVIPPILIRELQLLQFRM
jgi:hypothetical protein